MARYRVNHRKGIVRSDGPDLQQGDVWEDPPDHVLEAFGDRLDRIEEPQTVVSEDEEEQEEEEQEEEGPPDEIPTREQLENLAESEGRNALRSRYAAHIPQVDGNASAEEIIEQILDYYSEA